MANAIAIYTGGITNLKQIAIREDGQAFIRHQDRFGGHVSWRAWSRCGTEDINNLPAEINGCRRAREDDSFINNRAMFGKNGKIKVRLP